MQENAGKGPIARAGVILQAAKHVAEKFVHGNSKGKTVIIIPAYNESSRIEGVIHGAMKHVDSVIVVDDGSTDDTSSIARKTGARVLRHTMNCGPGAATMTGLDAAKSLGASIAITIDADGQHNTDDIPNLLAPILENNADLVIGTRFKTSKKSVPFIRRVFNGIGNVFTYITTGRYVSDSQSGFKAFGPVALRDVDLHLSGFEFCSEIIRESVQHKWRITEVPIRVSYSEYTMAKGQSFSNGVVTASKILLRSFMR